MKTTPKRILALLLALGLLLSLCACGQKEQTVPDEPKMSTDKVDLLTKADKKTPERQPEEVTSQSDMSAVSYTHLDVYKRQRRLYRHRD